MILGSSGVGKTTLFDLITGLYNIEKGKIFLGNDDLKDLEISSFRSKVGYVTQDPFLINGTLIENITSFGEKYRKLDLENSIEISGIKNLVEKLPDGVESNIGESGAFLSGG